MPVSAQDVGLALYDAAVSGELDRLPQQVLDQASAQARAQFNQALQQALQRLEGEIGVPLPTSPAGARKLAQQEAERLVREKLAEMGVPSIPFEIPGDVLTVEGAAALAYDSGKVYLEASIRQYTGLPIDLPERLTVADLERTVGVLLPADAAEALELAIMVGTQYAASALAAAIAGATIGSAIPGLGTVIGVGMALGINAMREALKEVPPHSRSCTRKANVALPQLAPMELVPWLAQRRELVSGMLADEQAFQMCGVGEIVTFNAFLSTLLRQLEADVYATARYALGPYQVRKLLPLYDQAPNGKWYFNKRTRAKEWIDEGAGGIVAQTAAKMRARFMETGALAARGARIAQLTDAEVASLRWDLVTELQIAAPQVVLSQGSPEALQWYAELSGYLAAIQAREAANMAALRQAALSGAARRDEVCLGIFAKWMADNPQYADCVGAADGRVFVAFCAAWIDGNATFEQAAAAWAHHVAVVKGCGVRPPPRPGTHTPLTGFVEGALTAGNPFQPRGVAEGFLAAMNPLRLMRGRA